MTHDPTDQCPQWVLDVMSELTDDTNVISYALDPWEVGRPVLMALDELGYKLTHHTEEPNQ